jgi:histidine triad (HIT) family protein
MQESIFTKIIRGEIPSHKVYEDEYTFAFLDIHPVTSGHVLVVPKRQIQFVWDLSADDYQALMYACKVIAERIRSVMGVPYVGVQIVGVDVPHAHVHLIPFSTVKEFRHVPNAQAEPDHEALAKVAQMLAF